MTLDDIARRLVADAVAPDAAVACAVRIGSGDQPSRWRMAKGGLTSLLFDLASLTKPMTAVALALTGVDRRTPLEALLPEVRGTASAGLPLELFLSHRAGLEANRSLSSDAEQLTERAAALREIAEARRSDANGDPPHDGFAPVYSDLGYILAGEALARAVGARDAGEAVARVVLEPLGVADEAGTRRDLEGRGVRGPFAPTETIASRGGPLVGVVHDENAWVLTGEGGSGHAGLFGTVGGVLAFGTYVLDALDGLPVAPGHGRTIDLTWLVRERPGGSLRAGFDGKSASGSSAGERLGSRSFGHLGFTGTSLWIDPDAKIVVTLLTNRVCPSRDNLAIRLARPWAHGRLFHHAAALRST